MSNLIYDRQEKLELKTNITLTIVGCGGVGFWVAKFAAMSGVDTMYLYDPDTIEIHNLNRLDLSENALGKNKAQITKMVINNIRPDASVYAFPFIFQGSSYRKSDWIVDCTDKEAAQVENQHIAKVNGSKYFKAGYNGEHITIANTVAEWGDGVDGYTIVPSWVVPSVMVASLAVAKIMKYNTREISCNVKDLFN
jgi:tRNA A37 threonylcarbamoyladenosine dehydratase